MKPSPVGIVSVAVLLVAAGVGFGIAWAGGIHSESAESRPVLAFEDSSSADVESRPVLAFEDSSGPDLEGRPVLSFEDQELPAVAKSQSEELQTEGPIETGAIPATDSEASWMREYGHD